MAPSAVLPVQSHPILNGKNVVDVNKTKDSIKTRGFAPLEKTGVLDSLFEFEDVTPAIGREYSSVNIVHDLLSSPDADALLRDLAITSKSSSTSNSIHYVSNLEVFTVKLTLILTISLVSERGVVFFRSQNNLTNDLQKTLIQKLGALTGKPASSTLHIHPVLNSTSEFGVKDNEISTISSLHRKQLLFDNAKDRRRYDSAQWHSDIQFETCPADYTSLRLTQLPSTGGDTLWASGYDIYDRFSHPYQKLLDSLTANFVGDGFIKAANEGRATLYTDERGSPENTGSHLSAVHPVVRTNPVTGWKSIFSIGSFPKQINELNVEESEDLLKKFYQVILDNHDLQVRFKWKGKDDLGKSFYFLSSPPVPAKAVYLEWKYST